MRELEGLHWVRVIRSFRSRQLCCLLVQMLLLLWLLLVAKLPTSQAPTPVDTAVRIQVVVP